MKVLLTSLLLLAPAFALDLILDSITCDEALPYYATDFDMKCDGQTRCTFGEDAVIYGELVYNGTENAGVVDSVVYAESGLQFMTLEYKLFEDLPLNMCGKWVLGIEEDAEEEEAADDAERRRLADAADEEEAFDDDYVRDDNCPADGLYAFQVGYTLPAADDVTSWLATGWAGSGEISILAEKGNSATLVGYCTLKFSTAVTPSKAGSINPPSALVASLIAVAVVLGIVLLCIYCTCCRSSRKAAAAKKDAAGAAAGGGKYHDDDPIDMARSRSDVDSYHAMDEQNASTKKPWASPF